MKGIGRVRAGDGGEAPSRNRPVVCGPKIETQSSERQAGTTPAVEMSLRLGEADDVVEPRGHAARARGVGAERERHQTPPRPARPLTRTRSTRDHAGLRALRGMP